MEGLPTPSLCLNQNFEDDEPPAYEPPSYSTLEIWPEIGPGIQSDNGPGIRPDSEPVIRSDAGPGIRPEIGSEIGLETRSDIRPEIDSANFPSLADLFGTITDFCLKDTGCGCGCCPTFKIKPLYPLLPHSQSQIICSSTAHLPCLPCRSIRPMSYSKNGQDPSLRFVYEPHDCIGFAEQGRIVDIFVPEQTDRIGRIKFRNRTAPASIFNDLRDEKLLALNVPNYIPWTVTVLNQYGWRVRSELPSHSLLVLDSTRISLAVGSPIIGLRYKGTTRWTKFRLSFLTELSEETKALILVAFTMWVIDYQEKINRSMLKYIIFGLGLNFLVIGLILLLV